MYCIPQKFQSILEYVRLAYIGLFFFFASFWLRKQVTEAGTAGKNYISYHYVQLFSNSASEMFL